MDHKLFACLVSLNFVSLLFVVHGDTKFSCSQTPYPDVCESLITTNYMPNSDVEPFPYPSFRTLALTASMRRAKEGWRFVAGRDAGKLDGRVKAALTDCLELMEDSINKFNRCISSTTNSLEDSQTWISAALTNYETCKTGFIELNSTSYLTSFPFMEGDYSKLLSNSLAINRLTATSSLTSTTAGGGRKLLSDGAMFPTWLSKADRRLLQSSTQPNLVVAKDGSGDYQTVSAAVAASSKLRSGTKRFVIHVKAGVYKENVDITKSMKNLMLIGDGTGSTIVTGSRSVGGGSTTFRSATFAVSGDGFIARDITFENTAGPQNHQAVALRSGADLSVFYRCEFRGYQDTLYVYSQRQFYRDCTIYGTQDFIFGNAAVILQNCNIRVRRPMSGQMNTITAQGRTDPNQNTGIVVHASAVAATSDLAVVQGSFQTYLGRPWQKYSRTVFMKCSLGGLIHKAGWLEWSGNFALSTLYYGEHANTGAGAATGGRVKWPGFRLLSAGDAVKFTVGSFLAGNSWISGTACPIRLAYDHVIK